MSVMCVQVLFVLPLAHVFFRPPIVFAHAPENDCSSISLHTCSSAQNFAKMFFTSAMGAI